MKRTTTWLSIATVLAGTVSAWAGEPDRTPSHPASQTGVTTFVGDIPLDPQPLPYTEHLNIQQTSCNECSDCNSGGCTSCEPQATSSCNSCDTGCDSACDSGCDSAGCLTGLLGGIGGTSSRCGNQPPSAWARMEALLWWAEDRQTPVLIATAGPAILPNIPGQGVAQFGPRNESGLLVGNRLDIGQYFGSDQVLGLGGRFYGFWDGSNNTTVTSNQGVPSLGVPIFDTAVVGGQTVGSNAFLVGFNTGAFNPNPDFTGSLSVSSDLDFLGTESYARAQFAKGKNYRVDLIGGYTFHSLDDTTILSGTSTQFNAVGAVQRFSFTDSYAAENTFHGGQLGVESQVLSGRWSLSTLAKIHLGNMRQTVSVAGTSSLLNIGAGTTQNFVNNGLLTQGDQGTYSQNEFTFSPEVNAKIGYRLSKCATVNLGYSFLMWSDVALAGNHINTTINSTAVATSNPAQRAFNFQSDSFYLHGLDLGVSFHY